MENNIMMSTSKLVSRAHFSVVLFLPRDRLFAKMRLDEAMMEVPLASILSSSEVEGWEEGRIRYTRWHALLGGQVKIRKPGEEVMEL